MLKVSSNWWPGAKDVPVSNLGHYSQVTCGRGPSRQESGSQGCQYWQSYSWGCRCSLTGALPGCQEINQIAQSLDWHESTAASVCCSSFVFSVQLHLISAPVPPAAPLLPLSDCLFAFSKIWGVSYSLTRVLPNPFWSRDKPGATPCFSFNDDMLSSTDVTAASTLRAPLFKSLQQYPVSLTTVKATPSFLSWKAEWSSQFYVLLIPVNLKFDFEI